MSFDYRLCSLCGETTLSGIDPNPTDEYIVWQGTEIGTYLWSCTNPTCSGQELVVIDSLYMTKSD